MKKTGVILLFFSLFQGILIMCFYSFLYYFAKAFGIYATPILQSIHPIIFIFLAVEIIVSLIIIFKANNHNV